MAVSETAGKYAYAWGTIQSQAAQRATTAEVFQAVQQLAEDLGMDTPPGMFAAINELRSLAVQMRNAGEAFGRASPESRLTAALAPPDINARSQADRNIFPEYVARFDMTHRTAEGELVTITRSMRDTWQPGLTIGQVTSTVNEVALGLANSYGIDLQSTSNIQVVTV